jgi:hypothetical protein
MPNFPTVWFPKDDKRFKALYPKKTQRQLAEIFGVSLGAIKGRRTVLGVKKRERGWSKKQDTYLLANYNKMTKVQLAQRIGKCYHAIIRRYKKKKT